MGSPVFDCRMCGHCCQGEGGIVVSEYERKRLSEHLGLSDEEFTVRFTRQQGSKRVLTCGADGFCVFFDREKACTVHPAKPDVCRAWPFFRGNLVDEVSWELAQDYCPGIVREAGHAEFARQGILYLQENGLTKEGKTDEANALQINDLKESNE